MVINLDRRKDRRAYMQRLMLERGVKAEFLDAVDGRDPDADVRMGPSIGTISKNPRSRLDYACVTSHLNCWERLAASEAEYGLILEDDVVLSRDFKTFCSSGWIPRDADIVKLETTLRRVKMKRRMRNHEVGRHIGLLRSPHWGAAGYIISALAARRLLNEISQPHDQIDWILFNELVLAPRHLKIYQVDPAPVIQGMYHKGSEDSEWAQSTLEIDRLSRGFQPITARLEKPIDSAPSTVSTTLSARTAARKFKGLAKQFLLGEWRGQIEFK
jgi:glycosyl transferase family 25